MTTQRHIITCEYPPEIGGVGEYVRAFGAELRCLGEEIHVWTPGAETDVQATTDADGLYVHRVCGGFAADDLQRMDALLNTFTAPRKLFVQWVPHGYGQRSLNYNFCRWLHKRAARFGDEIDLMVHEPFLSFRADAPALKHNFAALAHRAMTVKILQAARRVWVSIPRWADALAPYSLRKPLDAVWLPVPGNIAVAATDKNMTRELKRRLELENYFVIGHFGTFGKTVTDLVEPALEKLLERNRKVKFLALGGQSDQWRADFVARNPQLSDRVIATGRLGADEISRHLALCDVMLQPFIDGVSSRRSSVMAALAHALPVVTTYDRLSEELWRASGAVKLCAPGDAQSLAQQCEALMHDKEMRLTLGARGHALYNENFTVQKCAQTFLARQTITLEQAI